MHLQIFFFFGVIALDEGPEEGRVCSINSVSISWSTENLFEVVAPVCPGLICLGGFGAM